MYDVISSIGSIDWTKLQTIQQLDHRSKTCHIKIDIRGRPWYLLYVRQDFKKKKKGNILLLTSIEEVYLERYIDKDSLSEATYCPYGYKNFQ